MKVMSNENTIVITIVVWKSLEPTCHSSFPLESKHFILFIGYSSRLTSMLINFEILKLTMEKNPVIPRF